jgi:hypothetical protein
VPSVLHQILVELFRNRSELAPELLRVCAGIELPHDHVQLTSNDLSQVVSTEYRADFVVELRDRASAIVAAVIVEVQLRADPDKQATWPLYVAALRAKLRCPVTLLVVTPEPAVASWARRPIELGHPGFRLQPVVISFADLPRVVDPVRARRLPELAVLSVMAHPEIDVATTAIDAIAKLPEELNRLYLDTIMAELPDLVRQALEARMQGYQYRSEFARRYYDQGHKEGRQEGLQAAVIALALTKLDSLSADDRTTIEGLHDASVLIELNGALGQAGTPADARAAFELVVRRFHAR